MGSEVTQLSSAASIQEEVAEGSSSGVGDPEQGCNTSHNHSDSNRSDSSNQEPANPASQAGKLIGMPSLKGRRRILIIDDEAAIADTLALIFRSQMYEARVAYSAEQAIEVIAEWRPDLAIMDVILPGMNGIDLAIVTKSNYPGCHVILFSGHANTSLLLEEAGRKGHQFEVLAKPVHPSLMLERAADLLDRPEEPAYD
jgi:CheY-like chemotaxis protein